jgi:hypothetical protein
METLAKKDILQRIVFTQKIFRYAVRNTEDSIIFADVNSVWRECFVYYCNAPSMDELKNKIISIILVDIQKNEQVRQKIIHECWKIMCDYRDKLYSGHGHGHLYLSGLSVAEREGKAKAKFYEGFLYCGKDAVKYIRLASILGYDFIYRDKRGNTFMHYAAKHGYLTILKALLCYYPQMAKIKNCKGKTPYSLALSTDNIKKFEMYKRAESYVKKINEIFMHFLHTKVLEVMWKR